MIKYSCKNGHVELETDGTGEEVVTDAVLLVITLYRKLLEEDPRVAAAFRKIYTANLNFLMDAEEINM